MPDVLITPASNLIEFKDAANATDATIQLNASDNLVIANPGGTLTLGNVASNVIIGDGVATVDLIFEQNGSIRAATGKTLTLGASGSSISISSNVTFTSTAVANVLNLNNNNIVGVNSLTISDPGVDEGILWAGGNLWRIYESPDGLTNAAGNLQFVQNTTRRATLNTSGQLQLPATANQIILGANLTISGNTAAARTYTIPDVAANATFVMTAGNVTVAGNKTFSGIIATSRGALGGTAANELVHTTWVNTTANTDNLITRMLRVTTGADWQTAAWELRRRVDTTDMAFIRFGGTTDATRMSFGSGTTERVTLTSGSLVVATTLQITGTATTAGHFNASTTAPSSTTRLNYNGNFYATNFFGNGANLTSLNASNLGSGTVATARLGTGTANSTTFLRGDQQWATVTSGITVTNDTATNSARYLLFTSATSGTITGSNVSSTKLEFNPSTGTLKSAVLQVGAGTTAQRPTPQQGMFWFNTDLLSFEGYNGTDWAPIGGSDEFARTLAIIGL